MKNWFDANIERKTQLKGYNSFIATDPKEEYQMDLFFMNYLKDPEFNIGLLMVDIFTKFVSIIPMKANNVPAILEAMKDAITKMIGKPTTLFTDDEGGLNTPLIQNYLQDHGIAHIHEVP